MQDARDTCVHGRWSSMYEVLGHVSPYTGGIFRRFHKARAALSAWHWCLGDDLSHAVMHACRAATWTCHDDPSILRSSSGGGDMALHDVVAMLRADREKAGLPHIPDAFQGVSKEKIRRVLTRVHLGDKPDLVDAVFALLDDQLGSWFPKAPEGTKFSDGASTAHVACHVGILQRGTGKLDREGRDYWVKPLRELGGIEPVLLNGGTFIAGHVVAKSPNSAYRLNDDFKAILQAPDAEWPSLLSKWAREDAARERKEFQATMAEKSRQLVDTGHSDLIRASVEEYAPRFLAGYQVIYVDDSDGDRISDEERQTLARAGISLGLADAMPDVLLWNPATDFLWVIEAVTSDGEVDLHKMRQVQALASRCGKAGVGLTTTYRTWKDAAARQGPHGNLAVGSFMWIRADPAKQFRVDSFG